MLNRQPEVSLTSINLHLYAMFPPDLVRHFPDDAQIEVVYGKPNAPLSNSRWFNAFDLKSVAEFAEVRNANGDNVYIGAALRRGPVPKKGRAKTENFLAAQHAWIEYDNKGDDQRITEICKDKGLEPAIIITTGTVPNPRRHLYFGIEDGIADVVKLKAINQALRDLFGSDDVIDPIRIMRLGGCVNTPKDEKQERGYITEIVTVWKAPEPRSYGVDELLALGGGEAKKSNPFEEIGAGAKSSRRSDDDLQLLLEQSRNKGQWHNSMRDAIASMIGRGWTDDAIRTTCGQYCKAGRDDDDLLLLIQTAREKWNSPDPEKEEASVEIKFLDMTNWDDEPPPPREWAVRDHIPLRQPTLLNGEGGVGKTILLLQLLVATVLDCEWIGLHPEHGSVLYLGAEDEADEIRRRLTDIASHYCGKFSDMQGKLFVTSYAGRDATLARFDRQNRIEPTPLYSKLLKQAREIRPKIIALDTLSDIFSGNESDRVQVSAFLNLMRHLSMTANAGLIINSHPSLQGMSSGTGSSGSTGWHGKVRSRMYFRAAKSDDGEYPASDLRILEFKKNQYGRMGDSIALRWSDGVFIPEPAPGSVEHQLAEHQINQLFMTLLERFIRHGRNVCDRKGTTYAPAKFAEEPEAQSIKATNKALEAAMRRLFAANKIRIVEEGPASRRRSRLAIV